MAASEALALRLARHPFIVRLEQAFQTQTAFAFLLELCPTDLNRVVCESSAGSEDGRCVGLPAERAARYMGQVLLALTYLHESEGPAQVHRDVKPENILISPRDEAKLADFGLARDLREITSAEVGTISGTIGFMAPELLVRSRQTAAQGEEDMLAQTCKQDAYAFAVTLQLALLGEDAGRRVEARGKGSVILPLAASEDETSELLGRLLEAGRISPDARHLLVDRLLPFDPARRARLADGEVIGHPFFLQTLGCVDLADFLMPSRYVAETPSVRSRAETPCRSRASFSSFFP